MLARRSWRTVHCALLPLLLAFPAAARAEEPPAGHKPGVHIVRPGDTLEQLAEVYLGAARRWPELARLNPDVHDPRRLQPGSRLRIFLAPSGGTPAAQIEILSRTVDERPSPIPWSPAVQGDLLVEEDGVRTAAKSSAAMRFTDGTRLLVTEDSLVFLRRSGDRLKATTAKKAVEIVEGQADLSSDATGRTAGRASASSEIEVRLGNTRATSRPSPAGVLNTRARRPGEGGAKVMVYGGAGEVEAGGAKVAVAEGMGTSVGKDGPPGPPEKLLPAPRLLSPPANAELGFSNPVFSWQPMPEAAAYVVELCRDPGCGQLLDRAVRPVTDSAAEWHPETLAAGTFYWRITARSRSGLDGYPAEPSRLTLLSDRPDREPPAAKLTLEGPRIEVAGKLYTGGGTGGAGSLSFQIAADDAGCGLLESAPTVDGRAGAGPWPAGEHHAGGYAVDRCGNRLEVPPVAFIVDTEPPAVHTEIASRSILEREGEPRAVRPGSRRKGEPATTGLYWSSDGRRWLSLWRPAEGSAGAVYGGDEMASERPQIFLRGIGVRLSIDGKTVGTAEGQLLWLKVEDQGAGVERLRFHAEAGGTGSGGTPVLQLEAVDLVGNARRLSWPLVVP